MHNFFILLMIFAAAIIVISLLSILDPEILRSLSLFQSGEVFKSKNPRDDAKKLAKYLIPVALIIGVIGAAGFFLSGCSLIGGGV